jgi:hypothetical protein
VVGGKVRFPARFAGPLPSGEVERWNQETGDAVFGTYQWRSYMVQRLHDGDIPLWDPHRFGGVPFAANIVIGMWYPPNWLYLTGNIMWAFTAIALLSLLGALLLAYWFLRLLRLHPYASCLGAIGFALSGFMMKWSEHESIFGSGMWLPLALGGMELIHRDRRARGIVLCGSALALSVLAGHAQVALYVWYATAGWAAVAGLSMAVNRAGTVREVAAPIARAAALSIAPFLLAAALAGIQIVPSAELAGRIVRQGHTFEEELRTRLPSEHLPTFLIPDYRGSPLDFNFAGPGAFYLETAVYPGIAMLPLAAAGLAHRRRRLALSFAGLTVVGLICMFGTPLYRLVFAFPGLSRVWWLDRYVFFVNVGIAGLAALGLDTLLKRRAARLRLVAAGVAAAAAVLAALLTIRGNGVLPDAYLLPRGVRAVALVVCAGVAAVLVVPRRVLAGLAVVGIAAVDLWLWGFPLHPFHQTRPFLVSADYVEYLQRLPGPRPRYASVNPSNDMAFNAAMHYGLYDIGGYDISVPLNMVELLSVTQPQVQDDRFRHNFVGPFEAESFASPVMDLLGVEAVVSRPDGPQAPGAVPGYSGSFLTIARRPGALPAAFVAPCWESLPPDAVLRELRSAPGSTLARTAYVREGPAARGTLPDPSRSDCDASGTADVVTYAPERVEAEAHSASGGVLVLTDTWFPGWKATVDGSPTSVLEVDHALRGVYVPPGTHKVTFEYRPASFTVGASATLLTLAGLAAWGFRRTRSGRKPRRLSREAHEPARVA